jgi:glutathione synthase/RimK-type ligase-like ATP-grasp enzyme
MSKQPAYLGILATPSTKHPPFPDKAFYAYLSLAGKKIGLPVYVFLPHQVDYTSKTVIGYRYTNQKTWERRRFPLPAFVYDRLSNRKRYASQIKSLKSCPSVTFLGHVLGDKMKNHQHLIQHSGLLPYMTPTELVHSIQDVKTALLNYGTVVIKPVRNSLGVGVIKITSETGTHQAEGRDMHNKIFHKYFPSRASLMIWVKNQLKVQMIVQPYLELSTPEGIPFDIRVLVQKDGTGNWSETGKAIRAGVVNGLTSNLCGGGKAHNASSFLRKYYDENQISVIEEKISYIVRELPPFLEGRHGRLVELGIDVGVDKDGEVWVIEVNSKPGRTSFQRIEEGIHFNQARLKPLKYAYYLAKQNNWIRR